MSIRFEDVTYVYNPKTPEPVEALHNISLEIEEGSFTALIGRTGCGKSTLVQHLNALLHPTSGTVFIDTFVNASQKKKRDKKLKPLREKVGLVFQFPEYQLFEETIEKDVAFGPKNFGDSDEVALEKAHEALQLVGLDESFYKRSPFEISGGEKRRVALAGVLAMKPKYLVVDEPTAGLDPLGAKKLMELFTKIHEAGSTIILVTHDMDLVLGYCTDVFVLDHGKVALKGKPNDLFGQDVSRFSLQTPAIFDFAFRLEKAGYKIDKNKLNRVEDLAKAIVEGRR
ncbi:MAG: energy-coupling factor transporter ATPase [Bacilli bacterium]|nr:energy-coupling factor transporter ATPase [Bacilli bacterium]